MCVIWVVAPCSAVPDYTALQPRRQPSSLLSLARYFDLEMNYNESTLGAATDVLFHPMILHTGIDVFFPISTLASHKHLVTDSFGFALQCRTRRLSSDPIRKRTPFVLWQCRACMDLPRPVQDCKHQEMEYKIKQEQHLSKHVCVIKHFTGCGIVLKRALGSKNRISRMLQDSSFKKHIKLLHYVQSGVFYQRVPRTLDDKPTLVLEAKRTEKKHDLFKFPLSHKSIPLLVRYACNDLQC
jgi:hypothetical protein